MAKFSFQAAKNLLITTLSKEIEYETYRSNLFENLNIPPEMKILNEPFSTKTKLLYKNLTVTFFAKSHFKSAKSFDSESEQNLNDQLIYQISLSKSKKTLVFDLIENSEEIFIEFVYLTHDNKFYSSRHFSSFHPDTQEKFTQFLSSHLPSDLSHLIDSCSIKRNDELYLSWLKNVKNFLNNQRDLS